MRKDKDILSIGEAAKELGVSITTLRRWDANGKLPSIKSSGGHRYYDRDNLVKFKEDLFGMARLWASSEMIPDIPDEYYSETQDRFRARLDKMAIMLSNNKPTFVLAPLLTAIVGEVGNNSFDHNLGNWPDVPGIFFAYNLDKKIIVLADRGVGIKETLSRVVPDLRDDVEALNIAMKERISGRSPEQRGNGLKFVRNVVSDNPINFSLHSGTASATITKKNKHKLEVSLADKNIRGTLTRIKYYEN
ncbi:MAG: helix-turn-helix domain-containing protein [Patescibacteria group bacterium]|nr:helix-turn-helix domain-containing protein [Patescibacteria group bacterium]